MALIEDLIAAAGTQDAPVHEVITGPRWMMVTADGSGVAARLPVVPGNNSDSEPSDFEEVYRHRPLEDLLLLASSPDRLKASLGIAALNSALSGRQPAGKPRSFSIPRAGGKTVAVIGEFAFVEDLRRIAARVITVGTGPDRPGFDADPSRQAQDEALAEADIAIVRGSTLIDGTLEVWLDRTRHCYTVVYGPSTPLSSVLFEYGADQLVGIRVNIDEVTAGWIRDGRDDLLVCPGVRPVVIVRDRPSRDQQSK